VPVAAAYSTQAAHSGAAFRASFLAAFFAALCAAPPDRARLTAPSVPGPPLDSAAFFAALFLARCWLSCVDEFDAVRPCGETSSS